MRSKTLRKKIRKIRIKKKIFGTLTKPRVCVYRSNKNCYIQAVDDLGKKTLLGLKNNENLKLSSDNKWYELGEKFGDMLVGKKINTIVFDRSGYKYHGRIKQIADGIRSKKIIF